MSAFLRKYATVMGGGTRIGIPMIKAGAQDFATGADWVPAAGDVTISIDGGGSANITLLPSFANGQWLFTLTQPETTGKSIRVLIVDQGTKAVEDQFFTIETFGNANAMYTVDWTAAGGKMPATVASGDDADGVTVLSRVTGPVALASQIPANFTSATFVSAGVFSPAALSNAPVAAVDKTGYTLAANGLDAIPVETGVNLRQAMSPVLAAAAGILTGADTGTIIIKGGNVSTTRITADTDLAGNRTSVTLNLPA